ncbi:LuxR C-terminal-related transcriptional regulator [Lentzea sp. NPDC051838]|uniref:LuxR C-terminal-related transcriptional regulator n=1 Tax=Lentzea sp. NPDC051838 TaxID=3154849 RepID=UPI00342C458B
MSTLLARDYERMLDLAVALLEDPCGTPPWSLMLTELTDVLGCCMGIFADGTERVAAFAPHDLGDLPLNELLGEYAPQHVLARHYVATGDTTPLAVTDFVSQRDWRQTGVYDSVYGLTGATHQIAVPLAAPTGVLYSFLLGRRGRDFTQRERAYLQRVQPLLLRADAHQRQLRRSREASGGTDPSALGITAREVTVLSLLAEGLTTAAIARRLQIAPGTANKHRENLYRKLGAGDRVSAVLRAQKLGILTAND